MAVVDYMGVAACSNVYPGRGGVGPSTSVVVKERVDGVE